MSTRETIGTDDLARLPLFRDLTPKELEPLATGSYRQKLPDGETLVRMGDPISEIHWLEEGQLALRVLHDNRWVLVSTLHPGDLLGWSALREEPTALSTARAIGPAVMITMPASNLLGLLAGGSENSELLLRRLFGIAATHLDESREQLLQLGREGVITAG